MYKIEQKINNNIVKWGFYNSLEEARIALGKMVLYHLGKDDCDTINSMIETITSDETDRYLKKAFDKLVSSNKNLPRDSIYHHPTNKWVYTGKKSALYWSIKRSRKNEKVKRAYL